MEQTIEDNYSARLQADHTASQNIIISTVLSFFFSLFFPSADRSH